MTALTEPQFIPALEEIENVSMSGNSFDAEQQSGGGAVNITVKSGTNAIHGVLFEDHTDQHLQAYPWTANRSQPNPKYIDNQYGGTIGGPIKKDKLFYFASFEGTGLVQVVSISGRSSHRVDADRQFKRLSQPDLRSDHGQCLWPRPGAFRRKHHSQRIDSTPACRPC